MIKSILFLSSCLIATACASSKPPADIAATYATDDCKTMSALMRDLDTNPSVNATASANNANVDLSKDKLTWPWGGGTNKDKVSKQRAALRKTYRRKGCTG